MSDSPQHVTRDRCLVLLGLGLYLAALTTSLTIWIGAYV